jgi:AcrR family transcriptional regulator
VFGRHACLDGSGYPDREPPSTVTAAGRNQLLGRRSRLSVMSNPTRRGPGRPRKVPAGQQRALVLDAARPVFARAGLRAATIEEIAQRAGVTRQAVYEQFGDKNALFDAVVIALMEELDEQFGTPPELDAELDDKAWVRAHFGQVLRYLDLHPDAGSLVQEAIRTRDPVLTQIRRRVTAGYVEALRRRFARRGIELGRSAEALITMAVGMAESLNSLSWTGDQPDTETMIELLTEFTVGGMAAITSRSPELLEKLG